MSQFDILTTPSIQNSLLWFLPPPKKTLFELSLETHFFIKHLPYNYTYIPCQICVFGSCLEGGTCQGFLTNFAILRGGYFLLILFWHIANQIYSLASFKFINRCPSPVLWHRPLLVYSMSSRCHLISSVSRISKDVLWSKNREIVTTLAPFGRNVTTFTTS